MSRYVVALDQGTTSSRTILFDEEGRVASLAQQEFRQHYPKPGWVEHDPREIWSSQVATLAEATSGAGIRPREIAALGITNQRETVLVWERSTGRPIHNAIVWQDRRTADLCERLEREGYGDWVAEKTGLRLDPYFSATKLAWILDNVEGARRRAEAGELAFGTVDAWLVWQLTDGAVHATDATNASRTLLYNIRDMGWDGELLELFRIPRELLPEVRSCSEVYGDVSGEVLARQVPIAGIAGDQQAALFGQLATEPGEAKQSYGTGGFLVLNTGAEIRASEHDLLSTVAWQLDGETTYALEGSIYVMGAVVQWLRDGLGLIRESAEIEELAGRVEDNGGVYLVPAFTGLGAPHWDPHARGAVLGLTRGATAGHLARAALEAMAYQTVDVLDAMEADTGLRTPELRVDGGATANDLLMQLQADLAGTALLRPQVLETTALGAAFFAGLATGVWESVDQLRALRSEGARFVPQMEETERARLLRGWRRAVQRAKAWAREEEQASP